MSVLVRTQLMLLREQRDRLNEIAAQSNRSISDVVRKMISAQLRQHRYEKMQIAAELLKSEYELGGLMDMSDLDGEDILDE
ncbi:MAG: hypothetical protein JEZ00_00415 [Anaerolineaceae bacterium]|nr:hypothetical protein [Anaerolineaceae bacterium]